MDDGTSDFESCEFLENNLSESKGSAERKKVYIRKRRKIKGSFKGFWYVNETCVL